MAERITGRPWSAYEDLLLSKAVAEYDGEADWKTIAQRVPGRTNKACRKVRFAIIACLFLWQIPLGCCSSDGFTRCPHRSRNQHGLKRKMRS
jgi:hypothetical protein